MQSFSFVAMNISNPIPNLRDQHWRFSKMKQLIISKDPETNQFEWFMSDGIQLKQRAFTRLPEKVHEAVQDFLDGKM